MNFLLFEPAWDSLLPTTKVANIKDFAVAITEELADTNLQIDP